MERLKERERGEVGYCTNCMHARPQIIQKHRLDHPVDNVCWVSVTINQCERTKLFSIVISTYS